MGPVHDRLTILSPHRDDAVFSLAFFLDRLAGRQMRITVVNIFTRSAYGPRCALDHETSEDRRLRISMLRAHEDRRAFRILNPEIRVLDHSLLDAPLRRETPVESVLGPNSVPVLEAETKLLARRLLPHITHSLILCPLGLGGHVDHLTVKAAALNLSPGRRLAFYEDVPYVRWSSGDEMRHRIDETGLQLQSYFVRTDRNSWYKARLAAQYQSQISKKEASTIGRDTSRLSVGETIWAPRHSISWIRLLKQ